jgi:glycosyltransferase involved in cell wall biosynthesis
MNIEKRPKVSVIIPSYNHGKFIEAAITSVLNQSFQDFEIVISDDASKDDSIEKIKRFTDPRIKLFEFKENVGAVYNTNSCIEKARGEYIALLNSDDLWLNQKLEKQVKFLEENKNIGAVFTEALFVNEREEVLTKETYQWADVFKQGNKTSGEWLNYFFFKLNCLCHPSVMIRKEVYDKTRLYNPCFRQLPDFAMWVDLVKFTSIHILEDKLVQFKILTSSENASADTQVNRVRNINEIYLIMKDFFHGVSREDFVEGFRELLINKEISTDEEMLCEQAFIYLKNPNEISFIYRLIGIEKIYDLLRNEKTKELLYKNYDFNENEFFNLTGNLEIKDFTDKRFKDIVTEGVKREFDTSSVVYRVLRKIYKKMKGGN